MRLGVAPPFRAFEFFAGGGFARLGLAPAGFEVAFANDICPKKAAAYAANFGDDHLWVDDVAALTPSDLPGRPDLVWASFPCQDLSLAGARAGLDGARSGAFWPFWRLVRALDAEGRGPKMVVIENVSGLASAKGGADLHALADSLAASGRAFAALEIDAAAFLPQSRPRLFVLAWTPDAPPPHLAAEPSPEWTPRRLSEALHTLPPAAAAAHRPIAPPAIDADAPRLEDMVDARAPADAPWFAPERLDRLLDMMTPRHRDRVSEAQAATRRDGRRRVGGIYRRTRSNGAGGTVQRAECRFDLAGCLRTPAGGSSRLTLLIVEPKRRVRARLLSGREAARLMGAPDSYRLPERYSEAYALAGDAVAVPAVRWMAETVLAPALAPALRQPPPER